MRCAVTGAYFTCLLISASAFASPPTVADPTGKGDPDAVTCREPQPVRSEMAMRIFHEGPTICRTNRFWAELIKNHMIFTANGALVTRQEPTPSSGTGLQPSYTPPPK